MWHRSRGTACAGRGGGRGGVSESRCYTTQLSNPTHRQFTCSKPHILNLLTATNHSYYKLSFKSTSLKLTNGCRYYYIPRLHPQSGSSVWTLVRKRRRAQTQRGTRQTGNRTSQNETHRSLGPIGGGVSVGGGGERVWRGGGVRSNNTRYQNCGRP